MSLGFTGGGSGNASFIKTVPINGDPSDNQFMRYKSAQDAIVWEDLGTGLGGTLDDLTDVNITDVANYDIVSYDGGSGDHINRSREELQLLTAAATFTDNTLIRANGAARGTQASGITVDDNNNMTGVNTLVFNAISAPSHTEGLLYYDTDKKAFTGFVAEGDVSLQIGEEIWLPVRNISGGDITNGQLVYINGSDSGKPTIALAKSDTSAATITVIGMATHTIENNSNGYITVFGTVRSLNTSTYSEGDVLYVSATTAGAYTNVKPTYPNYTIEVATVTTVDGTNGEILLNVKGCVDDILANFFNACVIEPIDFTVTSDGATVTGNLEKDGGGDITIRYSDGMYVHDCTPQDTVTLTAGTDAAPQKQYVYMPKSTKTITVSTSDWPTTEHWKIAEVVLRSAATTQTDGALVNRNWNDHMAGTNNIGHMVHLGARLRKEPAVWDSGVSPNLTIVSGSDPDDLYVSTTEGKVWQAHRQAFPAQNMQTGDDIHIVNHPTTPFVTVTNLNTQLTDAEGASLSGRHYSIVVWGIQNRTGETSHLMCNLPTGSYTSSALAISDLSQYSVYSIPNEYTGVGFLIARFTLQHSVAAGGTWTLTDTEDLRGLTPSTSAGGGTSGSGATTFLALTDTPLSYSGQANKVLAVNSAENAVELITLGAGTGDVVGPSGATDNAIARYNSTTGKLIQDSAVVINDVGQMTITSTSTDLWDTVIKSFNAGLDDGDHIQWQMGKAAATNQAVDWNFYNFTTATDNYATMGLYGSSAFYIKPNGQIAFGTNAAQTTTVYVGGTMECTGAFTLGDVTLPTTDGTDGQVLITNGAGTATWGSIVGTLTVREEDSSPIVNSVSELVFTNGTVTDNGGGSVSVTVGSSGATELSDLTDVSLISESTNDVMLYTGAGFQNRQYGHLNTTSKGDQTTSYQLDLNAGAFQTINATGNITLTLTGTVASQSKRIRVLITASAADRTITFPATWDWVDRPISDQITITSGEVLWLDILTSGTQVIAAANELNKNVSVRNTGTPVDNDVAIFTDAGTVEGLSEAEFKTLFNLVIGADVQEYNASTAFTTTPLDDFGTPDDNTDLNATTSYHGLLPKLGGGTTNFLRADGTWADPSLSVTLGGLSDVTVTTPAANDLIVYNGSAYENRQPLHYDIVNIGDKTGGYTVDLDAGVFQTVNATGNLTLSLTGTVIGESKSVTLVITASGANRTVTFPASWDWPVAPVNDETVITSGEKLILTLQTNGTQVIAVEKELNEDPYMDADWLTEGSTNAVVTLTQETNWDNHLASTSDPHSTVSDTAYGAGWDGDTSHAPSKNAVYDIIEAKSIDVINGMIETVSEKDYILGLKMPYSGSITETTTKCVSGSCTATFYVNTTALGGIANSVSTSEQDQAHSTSNTFLSGDTLLMSVSSNAACLDMQFSVKVVR